MNRRQLLRAAGAGGLAMLLGCSDNEPSNDTSPSPGPTSKTTSPPTGPASPSESATRIRPRFDSVVAKNLDVPWGIAFLPSGDALVSERDTARITLVATDGSTSEVGTVPNVDTATGGEGGLLGIALAPGRDRLYAYHSTGSDNRVVRMRLSGEGLGKVEPILTGIPRNIIHNGGRIVFGPDQMLYVSTGDAGDGENAQDKDSLAGKILRITPGGEPAGGNPFGNEVFSYGHRNVEGLAFDAEDRLWATEFGDSKVDELNLIRRGKNYGWPEVEGRSPAGRFTQPKVTWPTDECSPAGIAITSSTAFLGALQGECVYAVRLSGTNTGNQTRLLDDEYGRLRSVVTAPDGALWVTTSNTDGRGDPAKSDDRILRVLLD